MSTSSYYPEKLLCITCNVVKKIYIWSDKPLPCCETCNSELTVVDDGFQRNVVPILGEHKHKYKTKAEQRKRGTKNFREEAYDHLPKWEKKHFKKKYNLKD